MKGDRGIVKIVVTGDNSRYQFLRELVPAERLESEAGGFHSESFYDRSIVVYRDRKLQPDFTSSGFTKNMVEVFSDKIPFRTALHFPPEGTISTRKYGVNDRILVFDEFPYHTDSDKKYIYELGQKNPLSSFSIVLYRTERKGLSTDITTDDMAAEDAVNSYASKGFEIVQHKPQEDLKILFWKRQSIDSIVCKSYISQLAEVRTQINNFFELEIICWGLEEKLLDVNVLNIFTKYKPIYKNKRVMAMYFQNALECYFGPSINDWFSPVLNLYKQYMGNLIIWHEEEDILMLLDNIKAEFINIKNLLSVYTFKGSSEIEYNEFLFRTHAEIEFKNMIQDFFEKKIATILKKYILHRLDLLEELLNEK
jgi:hypothetical protein